MPNQDAIIDRIGSRVLGAFLLRLQPENRAALRCRENREELRLDDYETPTSRRTQILSEQTPDFKGSRVGHTHFRPSNFQYSSTNQFYRQFQQAPTPTTYYSHSTSNPSYECQNYQQSYEYHESYDCRAFPSNRGRYSGVPGTSSFQGAQGLRTRGSLFGQDTGVNNFSVPDGNLLGFEYRTATPNQESCGGYSVNLTHSSSGGDFSNQVHFQHTSGHFDAIPPGSEKCEGDQSRAVGSHFHHASRQKRSHGRGKKPRNLSIAGVATYRGEKSHEPRSGRGFAGDRSIVS